MGILASLSLRYKRAVKAKAFEARRVFVQALRSYGAPQLSCVLRSLGIASGDSVMLHSAFAPHYGFRGSIEQLIDLFIDAVGPRGNLLMVSLPYRSSSLEYLSQGKTFDVRKTPSMMGMVSEMFRRRGDVLRSLHPSHPVLVRGPKASWFVGDHHLCSFPCGPGTPFGKLAEVSGKAVFFNVPFATYTMFHYLEHLVSPRLPFPLYADEPFNVSVIDAEGRERIVTTYAFALETIRRRRFALFEDALRQRGLIAERRIGNGSVLAVRVGDTIDCAREMADRGQLFYDLDEPGTHSRNSSHSRAAR